MPDSHRNDLTLQPMVHVENMSAAVRFYERLGGQLMRGSRDGDWTLIQIGGNQLSLLAHPPNPEQHEGIVELNFESRISLDDIAARLRAAGVTTSGPSDAEAFGRQLKVSSPDGLLIKINEIRNDV